MTIQQRKKDHVALTLEEDVSYRKGTGFEQYDFNHNALPEVDLDEVETSSTLFGRRFAFPLFISSMTGGYTEGGAINGMIATFCQKHNLPFGVGSQRIMLERASERASFSVVREHAPDAFIAANIGGTQLIGDFGSQQLAILTDTIRADAVIIHLNPLQELVQPEGDRHFKGIEEGIARVVEESGLPVIVKETGAGISGSVASKLLSLGVRAIDIAGAGGTSWSKVENLRRHMQPEKASGGTPASTGLEAFDDWGIPTAECIRQISPLKESSGLQLIASGGIRSPFEIAKSLALGADFAAIAHPVITALNRGGIESLETLYSSWHLQFTTLLLLLGCRQPSDLNLSHLRKV